MTCSRCVDQMSAAGEARSPALACVGSTIKDHRFPSDLISDKTDRGKAWPYFCSCPDEQTPFNSHPTDIRQTTHEGCFQNPLFLKRTRIVRIREETEKLAHTGRTDNLGF